jgi:hypothetical protein
VSSPAGRHRIPVPSSGGRRRGDRIAAHDSRPRLRTDSGDTSPLLQDGFGRSEGAGNDPGRGRRAEKARRSWSASAPGPVSLSSLRRGLRGAIARGIPAVPHRPQHPVRIAGARASARGVCPVPAWTGRGAEREWTLEGNKAHGRIGCSSAGNGGATLRTRRRSKALKSAARVVSKSPPGSLRRVGRAAQWSGGLGRRTARGAPSGAPVSPTCECAVRACRFARDSTARSSALRRCRRVGPRVPRIGSPMPARPGDVGVRRSRRIGASPYRDDGPCQRVAPAPAGGDPAAPGSPGPTSRVAASAAVAVGQRR